MPVGGKKTYDPARPVYLRIGDWPATETSANHSAGATEAGVSVYDLAQDGSVVVPPDGEWAAADLASRLRSGSPRHLVQGDWTGCGGDGEPLLQNVVRIGSWPRDLPEGFIPSIPDTEGLSLVAADDAPERLEDDDRPAP